MIDYDFSRLNDKEFEVLCIDLIGASEGVRFERFKPGRDGGVDGRYFSPNGGEWILQAKHWAATPFSQLVTHLRSSEAPKVAALNPERYVLVVSHSLSRSNKKALVQTLSASCPVCVYGKEDLNDLLSRHGAVERRHFKLWISSSTVLLGLLNNAIIGRSDAMVKNIVEKSKIFAHTRNFDWASDKLNQLGTVIITGQPGIGKTTLAEQLILFHVSSGYELVCIGQHIHEAEQAYAPDKPQLFYFDDFLGKNYLEALAGHESSQIVNFIKRVAHDRANKKFVLTSRSTILNQGRTLDDAFEHNNIDRNEMEIRVESLSPLDKAHILYNHIWHSGLAPEYVEMFYVGKRYHDIIGHSNFNPRIIQFITDPQRWIDVPPETYWGQIQDLLNNPTKIWEHPFDIQLDDFGRLLVLLVSFNRDYMREEDLSIAYARAITLPAHANFKGRREFQVALRHLTNSLLTRTLSKDEAFYELFNPSLDDFMLRRYRREPAVLENIFICLRSTYCLRVISDMCNNNLITKKVASRIYAKGFAHEESLSFEESEPDYLARLFVAVYSHSPLESLEYFSRKIFGDPDNKKTWPINFATAKLERVTRFILTQPPPRHYRFCVRLLLEAISFGIIQAADIENYVLDILEVDTDFENIEPLAELVKLLAAEDIHSADKGFSLLAVNRLNSCLFEYIEDQDLFSAGYDLVAAKVKLKSLVHETLKGWGITPTNRMINAVCEGLDLEDRMLDYFTDDDSYYFQGHSIDEDDALDIDDLFQKEH